MGERRGSARITSRGPRGHTSAARARDTVHVRTRMGGTAGGAGGGPMAANTHGRSSLMQTPRRRTASLQATHDPSSPKLHPWSLCSITTVSFARPSASSSSSITPT